mmetsp:Transcript_120207/g.345529  ORF Transcript_120207/g.345529 Transcript_120207/m.345529 type:complete len:215 (+) Transcript_120207:493-1137(+)
MLHQLRQLLDLRAHKGGAQAVHLRVGRGLEVQEVEGRVEAVVDQGFQPVVVPGLLCVDPAAVPSCDRLVGIQRGDGEIPECAHELTAVCAGTHRLANVLDEPPLPLPAQLGDRCDVSTGHSIGVANDHRFGPRRRFLQQFLATGVQRARRAVAVDGPCPDHPHHVGNGDHGEGRHENLVLRTQVACEQGHVQRRGPGGCGQRDGHTVQRANLLC